MNTRNTTWAMLACLATVFVTPACALDGFEAFTPREVARAFGVGLGPGYHNRPCPTFAAREYNKMLHGQRHPGCLALQRSKLAGRVPHVSPTFMFPGEDGTPACVACAANCGWTPPDRTNSSFDLGVTTQEEPEPIPTGADGDNDELDDELDDDLGAKPDARRPIQSSDDPSDDGPFGEPKLDLPEPAPERDNRSIEELLEGISGGDQSGQVKSDFVPGEELRRRLTPETEQIFQREFPGGPPQTTPQSSDRSSRNMRNSAWW